MAEMILNKKKFSTHQINMAICNECDDVIQNFKLDGQIKLCPNCGSTNFQYDSDIVVVVCDEEIFEQIWAEITKQEFCFRSKSTKLEVDQKMLDKFYKTKRIPIFRRSEKTKYLFDALGIKTADKFCGIIRDGHKILFNVPDE